MAPEPLHATGTTKKKNKNKNLIIEFPYDPAIPLLGIYPRKDENSSLKRYMYPVFIAALFTIAKTWKLPKCPLTEEWIKKMWHIYTMEYTQP